MWHDPRASTAVQSARRADRRSMSPWREPPGAKRRTLARAAIRRWQLSAVSRHLLLPAWSRPLIGYQGIYAPRGAGIGATMRVIFEDGSSMHAASAAQVFSGLSTDE